ncbi:MAG: hypothetical protein AAF799_13705 [Myxococcota bacterium]
MNIAVKEGETLARFAKRIGSTVDQVIDGDRRLAGKDGGYVPDTDGIKVITVKVKQEPVLEDETLLAFCRRLKVKQSHLEVLNPGIVSGLTTETHPMRQMSALQKIKLLDRNIEEITILDLGAPRLPVAAEPLRGHRNPDYRWLTYETLFNQRPFRKTNKGREMGLYRVPLDRVRVFVREGIEPEQLSTLTKAFFPELEPAQLATLSATEWPWKDTPRQPSSVEMSAPVVAANRQQNVLHLPPFAVFPYNFHDNSTSSEAIGTKDRTKFGAPIERLGDRWQFWKTASRSCIVELGDMTEAAKRWPVTSDPWPYPANLLSQQPRDQVGSREREREFDDGEIAAFDHARARRAYSVKTGVMFVGSTDQQGAHKDQLELNSIIACLRSDLVASRGLNSKKTGLIVQTELLSVTDRNMENPDEPGDGYQVRDISGLDPEKLYIPPISIPYLDRNLVQHCRRFEHVADPTWLEFWGETFAHALGRAKAVLMLHYGLQMLTPNSQNWLLEFEPGTPPEPTGVVVVRDLGDAALHREVIWARYGGRGLPPQHDLRDEAEKGAAEKLLTTLDHPTIRYEAEALSAAEDPSGDKNYPQETGSTEVRQFGPRGTRLLWHRYSTLSRASSLVVETENDLDARARGWQHVAAAMSLWGVAHARGYIRTVEELLRTKLEIDLDAAPSPERYLGLADDEFKKAEKFYEQDREWEDGEANGISTIVHQHLMSEEGQNAIREL